MCVLKQSGESLDLKIRFLLKSVIFFSLQADRGWHDHPDRQERERHRRGEHCQSQSKPECASFSSFWFDFHLFRCFFSLSFLSAFSRVFFYQFFFRWKLLLTRAARTPFLKITMAEASALQRWLFVKISSKTKSRMKDTKRKYVCNCCDL